MPLSCTDCINSLDHPVRHGYGGKGATFENSAGRKTVELYAPLEISLGAESDALVRSRRHRICRHGLIMNPYIDLAKSRHEATRMLMQLAEATDSNDEETVEVGSSFLHRDSTQEYEVLPILRVANCKLKS